MCPSEFKIKDITESNTSSSYLDLLISIERDAEVDPSIYDRPHGFNFNITNFPFLGSDILPLMHMGFLSHSLYDMPWLVPHMDVLF